MAHVELLDEIAVELATWPGVHVQHASGDDLAVVSYDDIELGVIDRARGVVELRFAVPERDELVEHGDASPAEPELDEEDVAHAVNGPSDVTAALGLFDRRYRELRGDDGPYVSQD